MEYVKTDTQTVSKAGEYKATMKAAVAVEVVAAEVDVAIAMTGTLEALPSTLPLILF
jgi:hypothetical protein